MGDKNPKSIDKKKKQTGKNTKAPAAKSSDAKSK